MNIARLDFESLRDTILYVGGKLSYEPVKQSKDLFYKLVDHSKKKFPRARFILPPKISPQNDPNA